MLHFIKWYCSLQVPSFFIYIMGVCGEQPSNLLAPDLNLGPKAWKHAPGSQRLVLVGDQCQLPPTVQSTEVCFAARVTGRLKRCVEMCDG